MAGRITIIRRALPLVVLAAFGVVLIHICDFACFWNVCYNALAHFSVPVFVLISGYYLLNREFTAPQLLTRIARLFGRMLAWAAIYYIFELLRGEVVFAPKEAVRYLLTQPTHLWYQYALITLLLFTSALHIFTTHAEKGLYRYVLALTFALGSLVLIALREGDDPSAAARYAFLAPLPVVFTMVMSRYLPCWSALSSASISGASASVPSCSVTVSVTAVASASSI